MTLSQERLLTLQTSTELGPDTTLVGRCDQAFPTSFSSLTGRKLLVYTDLRSLKQCKPAP